jgi:hypothetical protein
MSNLEGTHHTEWTDEKGKPVDVTVVNPQTGERHAVKEAGNSVNFNTVTIDPALLPREWAEMTLVDNPELKFDEMGFLGHVERSTVGAIYTVKVVTLARKVTYAPGANAHAADVARFGRAITYLWNKGYLSPARLGDVFGIILDGPNSKSRPAGMLLAHCFSRYTIYELNAVLEFEGFVEEGAAPLDVWPDDIVDALASR